VTSTDGITWTGRTSTTTSNRYGVASNNNNNLVRLDNTTNSLEISTGSYYQEGYSNIGISIGSLAL
jgi:hypothetical protein